MNKSENKGFALITALVLVALVTSTTVALAIKQTRSIELLTEIVRNDQLQHHGDAVLLWANGLLIDDLTQNDIDSKTDIWNQELIEVSIEGGKVNARIEDMQSRFNINNLALPGKNGELVRDRFRRLLEVFNIRSDITDAIADWIDKDSNIRFPKGAEDDYYLSLDVPYRVGNQAFVSITEVLLVKGVTKEIFDKLSPYIVALPIGEEINVNTALPEVLLSLSEQMSNTAIENLMKQQNAMAFTEINDAKLNENTENHEINSEVDEGTITISSDCQSLTWTSQKTFCESMKKQKNLTKTKNDKLVKEETTFESVVDEKYEIDMNGLTVSSNYFLVHAHIKQYGREFKVNYILGRDETSKSISIISQRYNRVAYE